MVIKFIKKTLIILSLILLANSCIPPGGTDCNDVGHQTQHVGLIEINPVQTVYSVGDELTISLTIPSKNYLFGSNQVDIFSETHDQSGRVIFSTLSSTLDGNQVTIIKGTQGEYPFWFNIPYSAADDNYEFIFKIKLNRLGSYSIINALSESILFQGSTECNRFSIDTDFIGTYPSNTINSIVQ